MKKFQIILIILIILNMSFIYYNSSQPADISNATSSELVQAIIPGMVNGYNEMSDAGKNAIIASANDILRDFAHSFEFAVLGVLVMLFMETVPRFRGRVLLKWEKIVVVALFCLLYAVSDEIHQLFVAGREAQITDVVLDLSGTAFGIAVYMLILWIVKISRTKRPAMDGYSNNKR
jgi:Predicted integral membrane protein